MFVLKTGQRHQEYSLRRITPTASFPKDYNEPFMKDSSKNHLITGSHPSPLIRSQSMLEVFGDTNTINPWKDQTDVWNLQRQRSHVTAGKYDSLRSPISDPGISLHKHHRFGAKPPSGILYRCNSIDFTDNSSPAVTLRMQSTNRTSKGSLFTNQRQRSTSQGNVGNKYNTTPVVNRLKVTTTPAPHQVPTASGLHSKTSRRVSTGDAAQSSSKNNIRLKLRKTTSSPPVLGNHKLTTTNSLKRFSIPATANRLRISKHNLPKST